MPARVGKMVIGALDALIGKQAGIANIHTLCFAKSAFKTKRSVRSWLRLNDGEQAALRVGYVEDAGGEWRVRQNPKVDLGNMGGHRVNIDPGVQALVGVPDTSVTKSGMGISPLPLMPPIGGASGPSNHTPEMPDFESIYAQPEAQKRQDKEAEQSRDRRRSVWRDFNFAGFHGVGAPDEPVLRYIDGETSTADAAIQQPRHFLTAEQLRQHQKRVQAGTGMGYEVVQGQTGNRKKGKV